MIDYFSPNNKLLKTETENLEMKQMAFYSARRKTI